MQQSLLGPAAATPSHQSLPRCWNHSRQCHRQTYLRPPAFTCRRRQPDALRAVTVETAAPGSTSQPEQQEPHSAVSVLCGQSRLTHAAQLVWAQFVRPGDTVVDATCGNGHDTLALAQLVGPNGTVYAFDVQQLAINATRQRLATLPQSASPRIHVLKQCHSTMREVVGSSQAKCVCFNLGYLPGNNAGLVTQTDTSIAAVRAAMEVIAPGGVITLMLYHGHEEGAREADAIHGMVVNLPPNQWVVYQLALLNRPKAPYLMTITKRDDV